MSQPVPGLGTIHASDEEPAIDTAYNAAHLLVLEGLEAVRKRPGICLLYTSDAADE